VNTWKKKPITLPGLDALKQLGADNAPAIDIALCAFPPVGLTDDVVFASITWSGAPEAAMTPKS
jgi:hypothetical protein